MTAEAVAKALGGCKTGAGWIARYPAHDDRQPSLSITALEDGKVLACCHPGGEQHRITAALRAQVRSDAGSRHARGPTGDRLIIAERIETALSAIQATSQAPWAALSVSGLRTLQFQTDVRDAVLLGDDPGREGRRVRIPAGLRGSANFRARPSGIEFP